MVFERICRFLDDNKVSYRVLAHEPAITSAAAATLRGTPLERGAKALVMKVKGQGFSLFVVPAHCSVDSARVRSQLKASRLRFADREELLALTGLVPGCVPPFGQPLMPYPVYVDSSFADRRDDMVFTAGRLDRSIALAVPDYLACADARLFPFARQVPVART